jgi:predicted RNA-binding protein with PUA-like domain
VRYWLVKSPFRTRTWARVLATGEFRLYGIRNAQARQAIGQMQPGDEALFYFQQKVWGVMRVVMPPAPDPTSEVEQGWLAAAFVPTQTLSLAVSLTDLKAHPAWQNSPLLRQSRLSVMEISEQQWRTF